MLVSLEGKVIGEVTGKVYRKTVKKSKHFFRKYQGYAISISVIDKLKINGVDTILLHEKEENKKFKVSLVDFLTNGVQVSFRDKQIVLPLKYWEEI